MTVSKTQVNLDLLWLVSFEFMTPIPATDQDQDCRLQDQDKLFKPRPRPQFSIWRQRPWSQDQIPETLTQDHSVLCC